MLCGVTSLITGANRIQLVLFTEGWATGACLFRLDAPLEKGRQFVLIGDHALQRVLRYDLEVRQHRRNVVRHRLLQRHVHQPAWAAGRQTDRQALSTRPALNVRSACGSVFRVQGPGGH
jgi:hypothetical protein